MRSETGEYPVLLLDDVMSELDSQRREQLLMFMKKEKIQIHQMKKVRKSTMPKLKNITATLTFTISWYRLMKI